uniref:hypothetical protein n=1 Tax=Salmonella sp. TaxID=599 RepID=UPI001CD9C46E|nr:hypothetical protein [Salmonella sp.]
MFYDLKGNQTPKTPFQKRKFQFGGSHQPSTVTTSRSHQDTFTGMNVVYGISCDIRGESKRIGAGTGCWWLAYAPKQITYRAH